MDTLLFHWHHCCCSELQEKRAAAKLNGDTNTSDNSAGEEMSSNQTTFFSCGARRSDTGLLAHMESSVHNRRNHGDVENGVYP